MAPTPLLTYFTMAHKSSASSFAMVPPAASGLSLVDSGLSLADSGLSLADSGLSLADSGGASLLASGGASPPAVGMEGGDQTDAEVIDTLVRWGGEREQVEQLVFAQRILDDAMRLLQEGERAASSQPAGSGEDDPYAGQQAAPAFEVATSDPYGDADYDVSDPPEEDSEEELALGGAGTASEPPAPAALVSGSASAASDPAAAEEPASGGAHADGEPPLASGGFQLATRGATRQRKRGAQSYGSWVKFNEKRGRQDLSREAYDEWQQWKFAQVALEDAAVRQPPAAQARAATGVAARDDAARAQATMQASCVPQPILYALTQAGAYIVPGREEILFTGFESACPDLACLPTEWEWLPYGQQGTYALSARQGDEALSTEAPLPGRDDAAGRQPPAAQARAGLLRLRGGRGSAAGPRRVIGVRGTASSSAASAGHRPVIGAPPAEGLPAAAPSLPAAAPSLPAAEPASAPRGGRGSVAGPRRAIGVRGTASSSAARAGHRPVIGAPPAQGLPAAAPSLPAAAPSLPAAELASASGARAGRGRDQARRQRDRQETDSGPEIPPDSPPPDSGPEIPPDSPPPRSRSPPRRPRRRRPGRERRW